MNTVRSTNRFPAVVGNSFPNPGQYGTEGNPRAGVNECYRDVSPFTFLSDTTTGVVSAMAKSLFPLL